MPPIVWRCRDQRVSHHHRGRALGQLYHLCLIEREHKSGLRILVLRGGGQCSTDKQCRNKNNNAPTVRAKLI